MISNAVHYIRFCETWKEVTAALESSNRYLAKCRDQHPGKFVAMATCVPGSGDEGLRELECAVKEDDARAVIINSSHHGITRMRMPRVRSGNLSPNLTFQCLFIRAMLRHWQWPIIGLHRASASRRQLPRLGHLIVRGLFEQFPPVNLQGIFADFKLIRQFSSPFSE